MAINLQFVPARKKGSENPVLNGYRYTIDKRRGDSSYWKCSLQKTAGCRARITTIDKQLSSPVPEHNHDV